MPFFVAENMLLIFPTGEQLKGITKILSLLYSILTQKSNNLNYFKAVTEADHQITMVLLSIEHLLRFFWLAFIPWQYGSGRTKVTNAKI